MNIFKCWYPHIPIEQLTHLSVARILQTLTTQTGLSDRRVRIFFLDEVRALSQWCDGKVMTGLSSLCHLHDVIACGVSALRKSCWHTHKYS